MMRTGVSWGSEVDLAAEKLMWQDILSALSLPTLWKRTIETICRRLHHCLHDDKQNFVHQKSLFIYLLSVGNEDWKTTENLRATVDQVKKQTKCPVMYLCCARSSPLSPPCRAVHRLLLHANVTLRRSSKTCKLSFRHNTNTGENKYCCILPNFIIIILHNTIRSQHSAPAEFLE